MKNIALIYFSKYGQTFKIASYLESKLESMGHRVQLLNVENHENSLDENTDVVIFGAPVFTGDFPRKLMRWVRDHRARLEGKPLAVFTVSLNAADERLGRRTADRELLRKWIDDAGIVPLHVASFAGALKYPAYSWPIRHVMKKISAEAGGGLDTAREYEYTDWQKVGAFANAVSEGADSRAFSLAEVFPEHRLMDHWMPEFEQVWRTSIDINGSADAVDTNLRHLAPERMKLATVLTWVRTLGRAEKSPPEEGFLQGAEKFGNVPLEDEPGRELVAGLVGKFWRLDFGIRRLTRAEFAGFREPGYAVVVSNFRFQSLGVNRTRVHSEMRVHCTDAAAAARFRIYWTLLGPGIHLFMRSALRALQRETEHHSGNQPAALSGRSQGSVS